MKAATLPNTNLARNTIATKSFKIWRSCWSPDT